MWGFVTAAGAGCWWECKNGTATLKWVGGSLKKPNVHPAPDPEPALPGPMEDAHPRSLHTEFAAALCHAHLAPPAGGEAGPAPRSACVPRRRLRTQRLRGLQGRAAGSPSHRQRATPLLPHSSKDKVTATGHRWVVSRGGRQGGQERTWGLVQMGTPVSRLYRRRDPGGDAHSSCQMSPLGGMARCTALSGHFLQLHMNLLRSLS